MWPRWCLQTELEHFGMICLSAVFSQCLAIVLNNPLSHPALEEIVVTLKNGLHDKSEMVRAAFLDLLIKMKEVRAAKVGRALVNIRWKYFEP